MDARPPSRQSRQLNRSCSVFLDGPLLIVRQRNQRVVLLAQEDALVDLHFTRSPQVGAWPVGGQESQPYSFGRSLIRSSTLADRSNTDTLLASTK